MHNFRNLSSAYMKILTFDVRGANPCYSQIYSRSRLSSYYKLRIDNKYEICMALKSTYFVGV